MSPRRTRLRPLTYQGKSIKMHLRASNGTYLSTGLCMMQGFLTQQQIQKIVPHASPATFAHFLRRKHGLPVATGSVNGQPAIIWRDTPAKEVAFLARVPEAQEALSLAPAPPLRISVGRRRRVEATTTAMVATTSESSVAERYADLDRAITLPVSGPEVIRPDVLLTFDYEFSGSDTLVEISTNEFTAVCPWTGLPDLGILTVHYVPDKSCIELKSLKYYLLSYRSVGIVQEHVANRILQDLVNACKPKRMTLSLDYQARGGLHTQVSASFPRRRGSAT